jgi:hypothetical protein
MQAYSPHSFVVRSNGAAPGFDYVVAPPGYAYSVADGRIYRDGTCPRTSAPEMGQRVHAHRFRSHRAAARVASKLASATIHVSVFPPHR